MVNTNSQRKFVALPSARRPWFLIPADDPGAFHYFVTHMLSSKYRTQRVVIKMLKIWVRCGGAILWPLLAKVLLKRNQKKNA